MTSRERVLTTFKFGEPDRVPSWIGASPEFINKAINKFNLHNEEELLQLFGDDFRRVIAPYLPEDPQGTEDTPFGIPRAGIGYGMATHNPLSGAGMEDIKAFGNDFGSNTGPLLDVSLFDRFIVPQLRRLTGLGHRYGLKVMLHCCGGFRELIPSMIESGLDGLHAIQPSCRGMDIRELKKEFGDRIVFNGCIDSNFVLIQGTPDYVRQVTKRTINIMKPGGGFIAGASHDYLLEETPVENVHAMFETINTYGKYHYTDH